MTPSMARSAPCCAKLDDAKACADRARSAYAPLPDTTPELVVVVVAPSSIELPGVQPGHSTPNALNSARPAEPVAADTLVTVILIERVTTEPPSETSVAEPSLASAPNETVEPSENSSVPPWIQSFELMRSYSATAEMLYVSAHRTPHHAPTPSPFEAHSAE